MGKQLRSHSSLKLKACVSKVSAYYPGRGGTEQIAFRLDKVIFLSLDTCSRVDRIEYIVSLFKNIEI